MARCIAHYFLPFVLNAGTNRFAALPVGVSAAAALGTEATITASDVIWPLSDEAPRPAEPLKGGNSGFLGTLLNIIFGPQQWSPSHYLMHPISVCVILLLSKALLTSVLSRGYFGELPRAATVTVVAGLAWAYAGAWQWTDIDGDGKMSLLDLAATADTNRDGSLDASEIGRCV